MKVFVELSHFAATASRAAMRDLVARLEDAGASRVSVSGRSWSGGSGTGSGGSP